MTVWACARQGEPTTWHDTEREAESAAALRVGGKPGSACVVYPVEVEGAQDAATLALRGQSGANGAGMDSGATGTENGSQEGAA